MRSACSPGCGACCGVRPSCVTEQEEIRFDIIYGSSVRWSRADLHGLSGIALIVLYSISLPAVICYVRFMKVEHGRPHLASAFDLLFSIYVVFAIASIIRYGWLAGARGARL